MATVVKRLTCLCRGLCLLAVMASGQASPLPTAYLKAAYQAGISPELGYAAALAKSGIDMGSGCRAPWPWTLAIVSRLHYYNTRQEAQDALRDAISRGKAPLKIGLMQLDGGNLGLRALQLLDPGVNLLLGMKLMEARQRLGNPDKALLKAVSKSLQASCLRRLTVPVKTGFIRGGFASRRLVGGQLLNIVNRASAQYGIDPDLVLAVIRQESGFRPCALSNKQAQGLMQLIPETQRRFGVRNPCDPADNVRGGVAYLRWLLRHFNGDVALALAGYNAGEKAVEKYRGIPPYQETRHYVRRIMANYPNARHPVPPA